MPFDEKRRPVNLSGTSSSISLGQALDQARRQRLDRENTRKQTQAAVKLQAWWRMMTTQQITKIRCRQVFDADPSSLVASRSLIFLPNDLDRLHVWSSILIKDEGLLLLKRLASGQRSSWLVVIRLISPRILKFMTKSPTSPSISTHLQLMNILLNPTRGLAGLSDSERTDMTYHGLQTGYYKSLSKVIASVRKTLVSLPVLIQLLFFPLRLPREPTGRGAYTEALLDFALYILPIPELTSRLTKPISQQFAVDIGVFLEDLESLEPFLSQIKSQATPQFAIHCLSNLMLLTPPRYSRLSAASYDTYLRLLRMLLACIPDPSRQGSNVDSQKGSWTDLFRNIDNTVIPSDVSPKTRSRLSSALSTEHIGKLLKAADCPIKLLSFATYLPLLCWFWPSQVHNALNAVIAGDAVRFAKTLYIEKISDMPLGKNVAMNPIKMIGSASFEHWAQLLFFTDLFMLLNQQMDDKEFYETICSPEPEPGHRNPLDVGQFQSFLKRLCSIVYILDRLPALGTHAPVARGRIDWKGLCARLSRSLLILYCREIHRPRPLPAVPDSWDQRVLYDLTEEDDRWAKSRADEIKSSLEHNSKEKSEKEKILESNPDSFEVILAQQDLEANTHLFRYFPWPQSMPRELLFPHRLGDFYLMRFERTEDKFNLPDFPNLQEHRKWRRDACDEIILCYEAAIDLAPPDYPAKADLQRKLAFMLLWRFEVDLEFDDFRRAFVYLQNALDIDGSFPALERTIRIGWWFLDSFANISGMNNMSDRFASRLHRLFGTMFPSFYSGGHRTRPINYEELARDVAMFGDHPALALVISTTRRNVGVLTSHGLETLAAWYAQRYLCYDRGDDLDEAITIQNHALLKRMEARKEEEADEESCSDIDLAESESRDESEEAIIYDNQITENFKKSVSINEYSTDVDVAKSRPRARARRDGLGGDVAVVACGQQLAIWLKLRYEKRHSEEDLESVRALLTNLVMSYSDPTGMYECAFLFSQLPLPSHLPVALYDRAILGLHTLADLSLGLGGPLDMILRLHDSTAFISNIAAMAIRDSNPVKAVEWLENSRSLIWNKITSLQESAVTLDLERRKYYDSTISFHMMEAIHQRVLQTTYVDGNLVLRHLTDGPVIILNASPFGCDALVLRPDVDPQCLQLTKLTFERVSAWEKTFLDLLSSLGTHIRGEERKDRPSRSNQPTNDDKFQRLLEEMWVVLMDPILRFIWGSRELMEMVKNKNLPRLWWCRTGAFSFLPIHAAGLYTSCGPQMRVSDFVVSSYLPSLSSAISRPPTAPPADFKLLVIAQPSTPNLAPLPGVAQEVANIEKHAHSLQRVILIAEKATKSAVKEEAASALWLHAACHGEQKGTYSSFALHDGPLLLHRLAALPNLSQAEFAFLSACETATGDSDLSGEALHLAGGLYRLGYRSVIATMFSVRDRDAPFIADKVYEQLFQDERPDYKKAARALHRAIHLLQEANGRGNFRAWIPFLHIGI